MNKHYELVKNFLSEAITILDEVKLLKPEIFLRPDDKELIANVRRKIHSLKGSAGFLGADHVAELAHSAEEIFSEGLGNDRIRDFFSLVLEIEAEIKRIGSGKKSLVLKKNSAKSYPELDAEFERVTRELRAHGEEKKLSPQENISMNANNTADENHPEMDPAMQAEFIRISKQLLLRQFPFEDIFDKARLLVENTAEKLGKKISFAVEGGQIYMPKKYFDAIDKALPHILRNACDHGIESVQERVAIRKKPEGRIFLHAYTDEKNYYLNVFDDGRGIDIRKIRFRAVEKGVASSDEAIAASDAEVLEYIFQPKLSTTETASHISGRGIGLDAARSDIRAAAGEIKVSTHQGKGTTFTIVLPKKVAQN